VVVALKWLAYSWLLVASVVVPCASACLLLLRVVDWLLRYVECSPVSLPKAVLFGTGKVR
uniref:Transmembrane protein n=1 Tax=Mesocestoides corti TaxID=53468 RepID=A0A5K3G383_MESCO